MDNGSNNKPTDANSGDFQPEMPQLNTFGAAQPMSTASEKPVDDRQPQGADSRQALAARLKRSNQVELYVFEEEAGDPGETAPLVDVSTLDVDGLDGPDRVSRQQISLKSEQGRLLLLLPPSTQKGFSFAEWQELCQQLILRLSSGDRFLQANTTVHLIARDALLDSRQLQELGELVQTFQLRLKRVYTQRRQTAVAAVTAGYSVEQHTHLDHRVQAHGEAMESPLYVQTTVRSGTEIRHQGSIVVLGDVNPGGSLVAAGDIFVWGRLRGVVHAGSEGNAACRIMALHMQPTQLRIADKVARAPEKPPMLYQPEVAYINQENIRIAVASEFAQMHLNAP